MEKKLTEPKYQIIHK